MAPGQDDPVPMSAVGVPKERSGVVAARATAVVAAVLSLLVARSRTKEQLAMVTRDGVKVSEGGGGSGEGGLGEKRASTLVSPPQPPPTSALAPARSTPSTKRRAKQHVTAASRAGHFSSRHQHSGAERAAVHRSVHGRGRQA